MRLRRRVGEVLGAAAFGGVATAGWALLFGNDPVELGAQGLVLGAGLYGLLCLRHRARPQERP